MKKLKIKIWQRVSCSYTAIGCLSNVTIILLKGDMT